MNEIIYIGQEALELRIDTKIDISSASLYFLGYKKPDGTKGEIAAALSAGTVMKYVFPDGSTLLDQAGTWLFWAIVVFSDGRRASGDAYPIIVKNEGDI
jgi:hypothetical protein